MLHILLMAAIVSANPNVGQNTRVKAQLYSWHMAASNSSLAYGSLVGR
jgi:hypothetical protein